MTFKYDPLGRRIEKASTETFTSIFAYDGDNLIMKLSIPTELWVSRYAQTAEYR